MCNEQARISVRGYGRSARPRSSAAGAQIEGFRLPFDAQALQDLRRRLHTTRWSDDLAEEWMAAGERRLLRRFIAYWAEEYDWKARVAALNQLPHYRASVGGAGVHFLHFTAHGRSARPLLLINSSPSSFAEYLRLVPQLVNGEPAFDIVIPALPGLGYSDRPAKALALPRHEACAALMRILGYDRYFVAGSGHGNAVATRLALHHGKHVIGLHLATFADGLQLCTNTGDALEQTGGAGSAIAAQQAAAQRMQALPLQTLAVALADSPTGLARFILEKSRCWPACTPELARPPFELLADNLSIHWMTKTIPFRRDLACRPQPGIAAAEIDYVYVPCAVAVWARELDGSARALADQSYNVRRYSFFGQSTRFPAFEEPEPYASDLRGFAESLAR